jgi:UDP-glucose:(heptosyl)LPS alpha-1,3-glucosyltransferase
MARGHQVNIYAHAWQGSIPDDLTVSLLPVQGFSNHGRAESFARVLTKRLAGMGYSAVVGFNKMPGLDVYFAADTCFAAKAASKSFLYRFTARCQSYLRLEKAVFGKESKTEVLLLSEREKASFIHYYGTDENRFHFLPPGISKDRLAPENVDEVRRDLRRELGIEPARRILLMVGSDFKRKGVDRAIRAVASLPREPRDQTILLVVGEGKPGPQLRLASKLGIADQVCFPGGRKDVPRFLFAADLLLHPAYSETAGMVLIEALAAGLPVLVTEVCGYSYHIQRAEAGEIVPSPFEQANLNRLLFSMLTSDKKDDWGRNGRKYVAKTDVFSLPDKAADIIERVAAC